MTVPNLQVWLDDTSGAFVHNVTAWASLKDNIETRRGRNDEDDTIGPSDLTLRFDNVDGRFTLGSPTYGIRIDQRIRVIETVGAVTSNRFTGYVEDWPTSWPSPTASHAVANVTAVDRQARLARRKLAGTFLDIEMTTDAPLARYTLRDGEGSVTAGDVSGRAQSVLKMTKDGLAPIFTGNEVTFRGGRYLQGTLTDATFVGGLELIVTRATTPTIEETVLSLNGGMVEFWIGTTGQAVLAFDESGPVTNSVQSICDGLPHHIFITNAVAEAALYVDGALVGGGAYGHDPVASFASISVAVGGGIKAWRNFSGTARDFAVYETAPSASRILAHAQAATNLSTDTSDTRLARIASYAKLVPADMVLEPGVLTSLPTQELDGKTVIDAMRDVVDSEGGVLFIDGSGKLVMHNRLHRAITSTAAPALALNSADVNDPVVSVDKQYLENYITGSREGGATQVVVNQPSIDLYEQYPNEVSRALYTDDEQVADLISWRVSVYGEPTPRLPSVTLDLRTLPAAIQQAALQLELGDRITVSGLPVQSPFSSADLLVEGWTETVSDQAWDLVLNTVPAMVARGWVLGDATYGVLDSTTRLFY